MDARKTDMSISDNHVLIFFNVSDIKNNTWP